MRVNSVAEGQTLGDGVDSAASVYDTLRERGFVYQVSDEAGLRRAFEQPLTAYCGFDPTADSLHMGHLMGIMALMHLQRAGHRPIALMGGGTVLVGDPSGKTSMRPILSPREIRSNLEAMRPQMARYLDFSSGNALLLNNADWLTKLNYIEFLRDIGRHFSVNVMLAAEVYKTRLESGLNFIELNYMLLQAYDFLHLHREYGCRLQIGGSDQWSNCLAGNDLIRRTEHTETFTLVWPLLTTASGQKMGKTEKGAVWLSPDRTSPYDFYQYWINTEDADVERLLAVFTLLPMARVRELGRLKGADLREAKRVLAHEVTALTHGDEEAQKAQVTSEALFSGEGEVRDAPAIEVERSVLSAGIPAHELFAEAFGKSRREARETIKAGGAYLDGEAVEPSQSISVPGLLRWGKKDYRQLRVKGSA
ncbi:MAG: tyrosine--tRNA ligase [Chloroflexota bacterium]|nr:tyrosine--tRNA ligase [Chloroflexota bacterium]